MDKLKNKLCKVCSKKSKIKCEQCGRVSYCSRECQFKDWNKHKKNCKYIAKSKLISNNNSKYNNNKNEIENIKKSDKKKNITDEFNLKINRRKRHYQTISIKSNNLSGLTNVHYNQKKSIEDVEIEKIYEESNSLEKSNEDNKLNFHFVDKFYDILFKKDSKNESMSFKASEDSSSNNNAIDEQKNEKIKKLYDCLIEHRNFLIENILLNQNRTYYFTSVFFMIDTYYAIEKYILNFILLIKLFYFQKDPLNLIKADKALNILGNELFNINNNNKTGLLVFSINCIFKKCVEEIDSKKNFYQIISPIQDIAKRFLSLISCINKLSKCLEDDKMYIKSLSYYYKFFEISLKFISSGKTTEKIILKSNLDFNVGCILVKKKYLNSSLKIYKNILNIQKGLDPCSFICGVVYYNISVIFYVMDKIKESELYLNEGFDKINKILDTKKLNKQKDDFRRLIRLFLIFYAELNIERENFPKAAQCLKAVIEIMIDDNQNTKKKNKTQGNKDERFSLKFLKTMKFMFGNYTKNTIMSPIAKSKLDIDMNFPLKNKIKPMTALEYLYEIQFFFNLSDKAIFEEKMKSFINGLLDKIIFYFNEKEKKEKEKSEEIFYFRTKSKKKTEDNRRKKGDSIIKEIILPDLSVKNIVKIINSTENFDVTKYPPRERNKTIAKRNRNNFLKAKENEKQKDNEIMEKSELKFITKESSNKIINYLNEKMIQKKKIIDNEKDISDFKYFFLLLICLSYKQIEILNNTQNSNMPMVFYKNLPILFSKKFKNSLNPSQRNMFNKLRVLSLIRCKVLKDASKPISVNNINYNIFHSQINFDDFKLKQYSHIQEVIKEVNNSKYLSRTPDINEIKKRHLKKLVSYNSLRKRNSNRNSFCEKIDENQENPQDSSNNEQSHLYKKLEFDNDSYDDNDICEEDEQNIINYEDNFKYKEQYDIKKLRQLLKEKIINDKKYSNDEKDL